MQKFFCDNCGTQVDRNENRCPGCGRYFRSVKCPECGYAGEPEVFVNGCPSCGYAGERLREGIDFYYPQKGVKTRSGSHSSLSDLFYRRIIPLLIAVIIILLVVLFRIWR